MAGAPLPELVGDESAVVADVAGAVGVLAVSALLPLLSGQDVVLASYLTAARWVEAGLLAARPFDEAQLQQRRLQVLAAEGRMPSALVQQFTQALVVAIEEYGKRKVGRRRKSASAPSPVY